MLAELIDKQVIVHYSPVEGFASSSKGTIADMTEKWIKLKSPGKKHEVNVECIQIDRI